MDKIKIGIIGAGYIGGVHASVLARDERVEVANVYDIVEEKARSLAHTSASAEVCASADEVIEKSDAVFICTPNTKHTAVSIAAANAGKHVFSEKPMATNLEEAKAVLEAANKSNKVFQVGFNRRFAPVYQKLKSIITEESKPHSAHVKMNRGELLNPVWTGNAEITGGFLYETTIHIFDMMRFLFGEVTELTAIGSAHEYPEVDDFSVLFKFANGVHATMCSSADATWLFPFERVEVFCHHRTITTREMEAIVDSNGLNNPHVTHSMHNLTKEEKWGYAQEDRAFIDSILNETQAPITAFDGYKSVELVEACYEAVRTGKQVRF
jgi:myo-inositol 2-dehydrogenase/D-chiro-inositol 1-dehydrogenase